MLPKKIEKSHKKAFAVEVFMGMMLFSIFHAAITQASDITADSVIDLVNRARIDVDVAVLEKNDLLQQAAQDKAQDMLDGSYFAHVSPQGKTPWEFIESTGYGYSYAGENLAINYTNAEDEQRAWMDSPLHRKNILNPNYKEIGVAVKQGVIEGRETIIAVQMFAAQDLQAPVAGSALTDAAPKATVAGVADTTYLTEDNVAAKLSDEMDLSVIYQNNKVAFIGWVVVLAIAIAIVIIDSAALIHRKHGQLLILYDARNRHM